MAALSISDVLAGVGNVRLCAPAPADLTFSLVTHDSRQVRPGALFVALQGTRDGHEFIADAYARGAAGALGSRSVDLRECPSTPDHPFVYFQTDDTLAGLQRLAAYWRGRLNPTVVGVTGSVGKTTTKEIVANVLASRRRVLKSEGSFNNEIGLPLTLLALRPAHEFAVLEMGMYVPGEIAQLCRLARPRIGVVTNVQPVHLERTGSIERIAAAKAELVQALPPDGVAVLCGDDPRVRAMSSQTPARVVYYGVDPSCHFHAVDLESRGLDGLRFTLRAPSGTALVETPIVGRHNVYTCLAAVAVAHESGLRLAEIVAALRSATSVRLVVRRGPNGSRILDDTYNASPSSVKAALDLLAELPGRRIAVLGDMLELGSAEEAGHRDVGVHAAGVVHQLIAVGQRGRMIGEAAAAAGLADVVYAPTLAEVRLELGPDDTVLIKGSRGLRMETLVARLAANGA